MESGQRKELNLSYEKTHSYRIMSKHLHISSSDGTAKVVLIIFVAFSVISYLYTLFTGTYNGDYFLRKPLLSNVELLVNLIYTITPFFILFLIYKHYKNKRSEYYIYIPKTTFGIFLAFLIIFELFVTIVYGVGFMGRQTYRTPPGALNLLIQIFNRFNYQMGVYIYIIINNRRRSRYNIFLMILVIAVSILRASLSVLVFMSFFILLEYKDTLAKIFRKYIFLILIVILIVPQIVGKLYGLRDILRNTMTISSIITPTDIIFGKLIGRLSSFSNSAYISESKRKMTIITDNFSLFQYPIETLDAFYNTQKEENESYRHIMLDSLERYYSVVNFTIMTSTQGVMLLGLYQSFLVFLINLMTLFLIINLAFKLVTMLRNEKIKDLIFIYFCFRIVSGAASEYMGILVYLTMYTMLFLIINSLGLNLKINKYWFKYHGV
jgi:hypothetical protein